MSEVWDCAFPGCSRVTAVGPLELCERCRREGRHLGAPPLRPLPAEQRARIGTVVAEAPRVKAAPAVHADLERRRLELAADRKEPGMSERKCLVDGDVVGPDAGVDLCPKCAGSWGAYRRYNERHGAAGLALDEWVERRRRGTRDGARRGRPPGRKARVRGGAARPARPVEARGEAPATARAPATVEERLLDHYLGATDWANIALAAKREIVGRLLEVTP